MTDKVDDTTDEALPTPDELSYGDAIRELREILQGIENEDIDLDALSDQVERAALLIQTCRGRIERAEMRVRRVLDNLERAPREPAAIREPRDPAAAMLAGLPRDGRDPRGEE